MKRLALLIAALSICSLSAAAPRTPIYAEYCGGYYYAGSGVFPGAPGHVQSNTYLPRGTRVYVRCKDGSWSTGTVTGKPNNCGVGIVCGCSQ